MIPEIESRVLNLAEQAFCEAQRLAGPLVRCGPGCSECCHRPFAITAADARRLAQGLAQAEPLVRSDIAERAANIAQRFDLDFPGDTATGSLDANDEWREWFFRRHEGVACPVLDLSTGVCRLYAHRPVACRAAGPLVQLGPAIFPACHLNYHGTTEEQRRALTVVIDDPAFHEPATEPETLIAYAISRARI